MLKFFRRTLLEETLITLFARLEWRLQKSVMLSNQSRHFYGVINIFFIKLEIFWFLNMDYIISHKKL